MQYIKHFPVWYHPAHLWLSFDQPSCCKCSLHLVACWNCALKTSESSPNTRWQDGVATRTHCTNTSCSQPFACILHRSVMMLAPACSWKKAAYSTTENYPPSTDGSSWRFSFRRHLESSRGIISRSDMYNSLHGSRAQAAQIEETEIKPYGFSTLLFPRLLPITMTLPKRSPHKCEIITVSGIKNVNDECYASGRMIK